MKTEKEYLENANKLKEYIEVNKLPEELCDMLHMHLEYSQVIIRQLQNTAHNSDYAKCADEIQRYYEDHHDVYQCKIIEILKKHFAER